MAASTAPSRGHVSPPIHSTEHAAFPLHIQQENVTSNIDRQQNLLHFECWQTAQYVAPPMLIQHKVYRTSSADKAHSISHLVCWYNTQYIAPPVLIQHIVFRTSYADTGHSISHLLCWYTTQYIATPMLIQHTAYRTSNADTTHSISHLVCWYTIQYIAPPMMQHTYRTSNADTPHSISNLLCWYNTQYIAPPMVQYEAYSLMLTENRTSHTSNAHRGRYMSHLQRWESKEHKSIPMHTQHGTLRLKLWKNRPVDMHV